MQEQRKSPALLQREKKRFAVTEEVPSVAANRIKVAMREERTPKCCCKERKRDLQERRKCPALLQRVKKRIAGTEEATLQDRRQKGEVSVWSSN
ncbi:hypothetical protein QA612_07615 [Evansella sp. AB-P1]|uniref:hypothetical protein n=1 Tax=Evansella sp. AB-P1 TaxID=3037653 RepID=UPI00241BF30B|nr:hypothetical protein [Evansella sp. AB-P1]MDG5787359.1 hypothetical protein [Evansella sp. AB-P1]